jgi:hypothetical protein
MKISLKKLNITPEYFLKKCGYLEIMNPHTKENSFVRSLDFGRFYPRFHIYIEKTAGQFTLNLHLDAKKPSYEGIAAHSGEYDGEVVEKEAKRIQLISEKFLLSAPNGQIGFKKESSWIKRLFRFLK